MKNLKMLVSMLGFLSVTVPLVAEVDLVRFWTDVTRLVRREHGDHSEYTRHAEENLKRVRTMHEHATGASVVAARRTKSTGRKEGGFFESLGETFGFGGSEKKKQETYAETKKRKAQEEMKRDEQKLEAKKEKEARREKEIKKKLSDARAKKLKAAKEKAKRKYTRND